MGKRDTSNMAAIPALIILILGIALSLPNEANIGVMILETLEDDFCDGNTQDNPFCQDIGLWIFLLKIIGVIMFLGSVAYIIHQFQEGNIY